MTKETDTHSNASTSARIPTPESETLDFEDLARTPEDSSVSSYPHSAAGGENAALGNGGGGRSGGSSMGFPDDIDDVDVEDDDYNNDDLNDLPGRGSGGGGEEGAGTIAGGGDVKKGRVASLRTTLLADKQASVEDSLSSPIDGNSRNNTPGHSRKSTATRLAMENNEDDDPAASIVNIALREPFLREAAEREREGLVGGRRRGSPQRQFPATAGNEGRPRGSPFTPLRRVRKDIVPTSGLSTTTSAMGPGMSPSIMSSTFTNRSIMAAHGGADEQLVMLHCSLLLPRPEEMATLTAQGREHPFNQLSQTLSSRGLLLPHPHGSFDNLVDDLRDTLGVGQEWDVVIYAANGMMTRGAWERVWEQMERVDVELLLREDANQKSTAVEGKDSKKLPNANTNRHSGIVLPYGSREVSVDLDDNDDEGEGGDPDRWDSAFEDPGIERESTPVPYPPSETSRPATPLPEDDDIENIEEPDVENIAPPTPPASPPFTSEPPKSEKRASGLGGGSSSSSSRRRSSGRGIPREQPPNPSNQDPVILAEVLRDLYNQSIQKLNNIPPVLLHLCVSVVLSLLTIAYLTRAHPAFAPTASMAWEAPAHIPCHHHHQSSSSSSSNPRGTEEFHPPTGEGKPSEFRLTHSSGPSSSSSSDTKDHSLPIINLMTESRQARLREVMMLVRESSESHVPEAEKASMRERIIQILQEEQAEEAKMMVGNEVKIEDIKLKEGVQMEGVQRGLKDDMMGEGAVVREMKEGRQSSEVGVQTEETPIPGTAESSEEGKEIPNPAPVNPASSDSTPPSSPDNHNPPPQHQPSEAEPEEESDDELRRRVLWRVMEDDEDISNAASAAVAAADAVERGIRGEAGEERGERMKSRKARREGREVI